MDTSTGNNIKYDLLTQFQTDYVNQVMKDPELVEITLIFYRDDGKIVISFTTEDKCNNIHKVGLKRVLNTYKGKPNIDYVEIKDPLILPNAGQYRDTIHNAWIAMAKKYNIFSDYNRNLSNKARELRYKEFWKKEYNVLEFTNELHFKTPEELTMFVLKWS